MAGNYTAIPEAIRGVTHELLYFPAIVPILCHLVAETLKKRVHHCLNILLSILLVLADVVSNTFICPLVHLSMFVAKEIISLP